MPTRAMDADPHLRREGALGYLAIDGGAGQARAVEHGLQADDAFGAGHWVFSLSYLPAPRNIMRTLDSNARVKASLRLD